METKVLPSTEIARTALLTHPGLNPDKQDNEDVAVCVATPHGLLCLVCDGMGGHENGKLAANTAAAEIVARLSAGGPSDPALALGDAIRAANVKVYALSSHARHAPAGATCVAVLLHEHGTTVAHAGDSRAYLVHRGTIAQVTRDHSKVREMVDRGLITAEEARVHPDANQITRALGITENLDVEVRAAPLPHLAGDVYVLCSDGLSDLVTADEMLEAVMRADEPEAAQALVDLALERGGHDNTTVIVARVTQDAVPVASGQAALVTAPGVTPAPAVVAPTTERPPKPTLPGAPVAVVVPPAPRVRTTSGSWDDAGDSPRRSKATLALGLLLACAAVGILVALYVVTERRHHRVQGPLPHRLPMAEPSSSTPATLRPAGSDDAP